ncbi:unnamed protein product [Mytilus edulis]|uniref:Integrase zinc-binding domain-containing protein n=1 Tax=Mytilus edulis TaxID=6550 RepID=A0A8S3V9F9_MYTED|nr:unnamed protein product [Mytilus edulis]
MIRNVTQSSDGNCSSWLTKYTEKEMSTFQKEDPDYSFLHKWMDAGETPDRDKCASFSPAVRHYWLNWSNLVRIGGVIYQKWREVKSELDHLQLLVPAVIKKEIIISCHDTAYSGHFGIKKSVQKMKNYFTWYQITKDVRIHIENCVICTKSKSRKSKAGLVDYRVGYPLERLIHSTPHPATGFSPNFLMLGREISIPIKLIYPLPDKKYEGQNEYALDLQDRLQDVYQIARKHLKTNAERLKKNHDTRLTKYKYKKGDLVYKFDKTIRQKFKSPWLGPYLISKVLSTVVYEICFKSRTEVVHIDKLKPYVGEIPDWNYGTVSMFQVSFPRKYQKYHPTFLCKTCNFKTISNAKWQRHIKDPKKPHVNKEHICMKSSNPYVVIVSEDITEIDESTCMNDQIFIQEEEIEIVEVKIDPKDEQIVELENKLIELQSTHANQLKELEESIDLSAFVFGNFIERLEKRKTDLKEKVIKLKNKLTETQPTCYSSKKIRSSNSKSKEQSPACSIPQTPQTNHQTLYGSYPGYPFTPFQPPAPHTTPANMMQSHHQQLPPAMMSTMPLLTPSPYQYTNPDLNKFMGEVTERLKKLDMLEDILKRVVSMETHCMKIDCEVSNMKEQIKTHTNTIMNIDQGLSVPDEYNPEEDTEAILKDFIKSEIQIEEEINFHVVHRLKPKQDKSPRGIVAKFERRKDRNMVLSAAIQKLKNKKQFVVHEQYPIEVIERRRELVPILKDARTKGHTAVLKEDRLYIDNKRYYPRTTRQHPPPSAAMDQNGE